VLSSFVGRQRIVNQILQKSLDGNLAHSHLFVGPVGSGKLFTALEVARLVNCITPEQCQEKAACESCKKAVTFQHPDIRWICPAPASASEKEATELYQFIQEDPFYEPAYAASSEILIGDVTHPGPLSVRSALKYLRVKPFQGKRKIVIVSSADRLRAGAANAFLKTLEEPPDDALIILLAPVRSSVLPTILSRCQQTRFDPYSENELIDLLLKIYPDITADIAQEIAVSGSGNARQAALLLQPVPQILCRWAFSLLDLAHRGKEGTMQIASEMLHKGKLPKSIVEDVAPGNRSVAKDASDLVEKRDRIIRICSMLSMYYCDMLNCVTRSDAWSPRMTSEADKLREISSRRTVKSLLLDIDAIEQARLDIDRNLNPGLVMAVLFKELVNNAKEKPSPCKALSR
jgi:DNA polymerase III delta prime subunit